MWTFLWTLSIWTWFLDISGIWDGTASHILESDCWQPCIDCLICRIGFDSALQLFRFPCSAVHCPSVIRNRIIFLSCPSYISHLRIQFSPSVLLWVQYDWELTIMSLLCVAGKFVFWIEEHSIGWLIARSAGRLVMYIIDWWMDWLLDLFDLFLIWCDWWSFFLVQAYRCWMMFSWRALYELILRFFAVKRGRLNGPPGTISSQIWQRPRCPLPNTQRVPSFIIHPLFGVKLICLWNGRQNTKADLRMDEIIIFLLLRSCLVE